MRIRYFGIAAPCVWGDLSCRRQPTDGAGPGFSTSTDARNVAVKNRVRRLPEGGIKCGIMRTMAMTLRLDEHENEALRKRAELEGRSMQEVARDAIRRYVEQTSKRELLDAVLDRELPRYAEALERLGK